MTPKQQRFVREYLIDLNATEAARRAGYKESYARRASVMLRKSVIAAAIAKGMADRAGRTEIDSDRVLREYAKLAFVDIRRLVKPGKEGIELRDLSELSDEDAAAIVHLWRTGRGNGLRIKLLDKRPALDALARHLGLFDPRERPRAGADHSAAQDRARAALKARVEAVLRARKKAEEST